MVLTAVGLCVSAAGSWLTAMLVDQASAEENIHLTPLCAVATGVFSKHVREGAELSFSLKTVVVSTHQVIRRGFLDAMVEAGVTCLYSR